MKTNLDIIRALQSDEIFKIGQGFELAATELEKKAWPCSNCQMGIDDCENYATILMTFAVAIREGKTGELCDCVMDFAGKHLTAARRHRADDFPEIIGE